MTLKLDKLSDRETHKITFAASADLMTALSDYAELCRCSYEQKESIADLIPFMLEAFINADPGFRGVRKQLQNGRAPSPPQQK